MGRHVFQVDVGNGWQCAILDYDDVEKVHMGIEGYFQTSHKIKLCSGEVVDVGEIKGIERGK